MIITFSGLNGAGKTAASKALADKLNYEWWGMAQITRAHAKKLGMTIEEHDKYAAQNPEIDLEIDQELAALSSKDNLVVDSRAGWHFLPESFKVFLTANEDIRAQRCFENARESEKYSSVEDARRGLRSRIEVFRNRLKKLYGIDVYDPSNFDLVIDTSNKTVQEVVSEIYDAVQE